VVLDIVYGSYRGHIRTIAEAQSVSRNRN